MVQHPAETLRSVFRHDLIKLTTFKQILQRLVAIRFQVDY
jgi:hypothetical protein